jgi:hypothetical protein
MRRIILSALFSLFAVHCSLATATVDTLFSEDNDRVIINYDLAQSGQEVTVKFNTVHKKLCNYNADKYRKLDHVHVMFFDRAGNFKKHKFNGIAITPFMVPANISYTPSEDGFFILSEQPELKFTATGSDPVRIDIPLYLANYEKKRQHEVFTRCGTLRLEPKAKGRRPSANGGGDDDDEEIIESEEIIEEGISPAEEARIRMNTVQKMLDKAKKYPFSDALQKEISALRDLQMKLQGDPDVAKQVSDLLDTCDDKEAELQEKGDADDDAAKKEKERADSVARAQDQAHADSINAANLLQQAKDKKDMMLLIGGIAGIIALLAVLKQVIKWYKEWKQGKKQKEMMDRINKMSPFGQDNKDGKKDGGKDGQNDGQKGHKTSPEVLAARQRMEEMKRAKQQKDNPTPPPATRKPSLNDQIPPRYKRWRKPGSTDNTNNATI